MRILVISLRVTVAINSEYKDNDDTNTTANDTVAEDANVNNNIGNDAEDRF